MAKKLRIIIETVLEQFPDANLLSERARKKIADEIVNLYFTPDNKNTLANEELSVKTKKELV